MRVTLTSWFRNKMVVMKQLKISLWGILIALSGFWWLADTTEWSRLSGVFAWRNVLNQWSGIVAIGVMSIALILSLRPAFFEARLGGLDKLYRLHKWLGISALVMAVSHWLIIKAPKWMVGWGWIERGARGPRPQWPEGSLRAFLSSQRGLAEDIGEWAFYLAVVLMALALLKRFPYRRFLQTHRILALAYLALVYHALILVRFEYWSTPLGILLAGLLGAGSVAAVLAFFRKRLGGVRRAGEIVGIDERPVLGAVAVEIAVHGQWPGHAAGQFAFVTFHREEGPHPFSMTADWRGDGRLQFLIKGLGDYTRGLAQRLKTGDRVIVEGPYGAFDFSGDCPRQIWIGGGIGITPFMARLKALALEKDGRQIDLFHCTRELDGGLQAQLQAAAQRAGVRLHLHLDGRDARLDPELLGRTVPEWRDADIWFCGPAGFGAALREGLSRLGMLPNRFHQELFEMR